MGGSQDHTQQQTRTASQQIPGRANDRTSTFSGVATVSTATGAAQPRSMPSKPVGLDVVADDIQPLGEKLQTYCSSKTICGPSCVQSSGFLSSAHSGRPPPKAQSATCGLHSSVSSPCILLYLLTRTQRDTVLILRTSSASSC